MTCEDRKNQAKGIGENGGASKLRLLLLALPLLSFAAYGAEPKAVSFRGLEMGKTYAIHTDGAAKALGFETVRTYLYPNGWTYDAAIFPAETNGFDTVTALFTKSGRMVGWNCEKSGEEAQLKKELKRLEPKVLKEFQDRVVGEDEKYRYDLKLTIECGKLVYACTEVGFAKEKAEADKILYGVRK